MNPKPLKNIEPAEAPFLKHSSDSAIGSYTRMGYTPAEFAAHFGRHQSWAYRLLYAGKIEKIDHAGRIQPPDPADCRPDPGPLQSLHPGCGRHGGTDR